MADPGTSDTAASGIGPSSATARSTPEGAATSGSLKPTIADPLDPRKVHWRPLGRGESYQLASPFRNGTRWEAGHRQPIIHSPSGVYGQNHGRTASEANSEEENRRERRRFGRQASDLVRAHKKRLGGSALSDSECDDDDEQEQWRRRPNRSSRESSLSSWSSHDSRRSSGASGLSDWSESEIRDIDRDNPPGGILSNLLGLYGAGGSRRPATRRLLASSQPKRRRWNEKDLFKSRRHSRHQLRKKQPDNPAGTSQDGAAQEVEEDFQNVLDDAVDHEGRPTAPVGDILADRVPRQDPAVQPQSDAQVPDRSSDPTTLLGSLDDESRRHSASRRSSASSGGRRHFGKVYSTHSREEDEARRHRRQDPNEPYIPTGRRAEGSLEPSFATTVAQRVRATVLQTSKLLGGGGGNVELASGHGHGTNRTLAALVITTSSLAGAATPELAHYAPASGSHAERNTGQRRIVRYSNPSEEAQKAATELADDARAEAVEMGIDPNQEKRVNQSIDLIRDDFSEKVMHGKPRRGKRKQKEIHITRHIASLLQRQQFIEHLAKSLISFGAPSHNLEAWLEATADVLEIEASFIYFPSVLIIAFRDSDVHSTETLFIRPKGILELYRLSLVHDVYRKVVRDEISVSQGSRALRRITKEFKPYPRYVLLAAAAVVGASGCGVAFSGSFVDMLISAVLGTFLGFVMLFVVAKHRTATNIFEIGTAGLIASSLVVWDRPVSSAMPRSFPCVATRSCQLLADSLNPQASIVLILPGWPICLGALELGSRNIVSGAIRVVWAIIFTLFLSFTLSIGSQIWDTTGLQQPSLSGTTSDGTAISDITISGSFQSNDTAMDNVFRNGTFTFTNGTASSSSGQVACYRDPARTTTWWYQTVPKWYLFLLVPAFAYSLAIWNRADWRSKDVCVMVIVASAGYAVNYGVSMHLPDRSDVVSACAAFAIGLLGNIYSRIGGGSAFPSMVVGILLEVPNVIAAAGGLSISSSEDSSSSSGSTSSNSQISSAVLVAIRMVQTAIGLAVGLYAANLAAYPLGKKRDSRLRSNGKMQRSTSGATDS